MNQRTEDDIIMMIFIVIFVVIFVLMGAHYVRADERLPFGITCEDVTRYAKDFKIPNTVMGRAHARVIALTFGHWLTRRELDAATACLIHNGK
jgi:hypothetical protein